MSAATATLPRPPRKKGKRIFPPVPPAPQPVEYREIATLADLEKVCSAPVVVECLLANTTPPQPIRLTGKRLTPDQEKRVKLILEAAVPPLLPPDPERPQAERQYDFHAPGYLQAKETNQRLARALTLYWAFPIFVTGWEDYKKSLSPVPPGAPNETQIMEFIESRPLDSTMLDLAYEMVTRNIAYVDEARVGFMSGSGARKS
jgi:hypothetical protein